MQSSTLYAKGAVRGLWCLTPLPTIFQLYCGGQFYCWMKLEYPKKTSDLLLINDKFNHLTLYTSPWTGIELTSLVVISIDCTGSCKSNYHTITATRCTKGYFCACSEVRCCLSSLSSKMGTKSYKICDFIYHVMVISEIYDNLWCRKWHLMLWFRRDKEQRNVRIVIISIQYLQR